MSDLATKIETGPLATVIIQKYRNGETPTAIATWLQEEMLEFTEVPPYRLASEIKKYVNRSLPLTTRLEIQGNRGAIAETVAKTRNRVSVLDELEKLYALQVGRIEIDHATEKKINKLFGSTNNEIELARRVLSDIARIRQELGIDERAAQTLNLNISGEVKGDFGFKLGLLAKKLMDGVGDGAPQDTDVLSPDEQVVELVEDEDRYPHKATLPAPTSTTSPKA